MSGLKVLKASAGSGKTFRLTYEYLKIVISNPLAYQNILAVTFTHKATNEMKSRIIAELHLLVTDLSRSPYFLMLQKDLSVNEKQITEGARQALSHILHNFSNFSVGTIDSFFQKIVRSFANELNLPGGFRVELDNDDVLEKSVDRLLFKLDNHPELIDWIRKFMIYRTEQGQTWDIKNEIIKLGKEIFKEDALKILEKLTPLSDDKSLLNDYIEKLSTLKKELLSAFSEKGQQAVDHIKSYNLEPTDFNYGKNGVVNYFYKAASGKFEQPKDRVIKTLNNEISWNKKKSTKNEQINQCVSDGLANLLEELVALFEAGNKKINSIDAILKNIYTLGILNDVASELRSYARENNLLLLSDSGNLINLIIGGNETPFIYEKTGLRYYNFMIDEFQDTSFIQWENFKPLIENSLAQGHQNLVVGDIKQSIYRWRNSSWKILAEKVSEDISQKMITQDQLDQNWRSHKFIVEFNNLLYKSAPLYLQEMANREIDTNSMTELKSGYFSHIIEQAYDLPEQLISEKNKDTSGYIKIEFSGEHTKENKEEILKPYILKTLKQIYNQQGHIKDIAFLTRKKSEGSLIAETLLEIQNDESGDLPDFTIISEEALFLSSSPAVNIIINILRSIVHPRDQINMYSVLYDYAIFCDDNKLKQKLENISGEDLPSIYEDFPGRFIEHTKVSALSEVINHIIVSLKLDQYYSEIPYLLSLQDYAADYVNFHNSDINGFIDWWDEKGYQQSINTSGDKESIKIMTIHKSKGLEFDTVIVPFCDWSFIPGSYQVSPIMWVEPNVQPFNNIEILPVRFENKLKESIFFEEYSDEFMQSCIDALNMLYVTTTRPKRNLFLYNHHNKDPKSFSGYNIANLMYDCFFTLNLAKPEKYSSPSFLTADIESMSIEYGKIEPYSIEKKDESQEAIPMNFTRGFSSSQHIRIKPEEHRYADSFFESSPLHYGRIMHKLFENMKTLEDLDTSLQILLDEGEIKQTKKEELKNTVQKLISNKWVYQWFSGNLRVLNEQEIILPQGFKKRPDRVMIDKEKVIVVDYKFGQSYSNTHFSQVRSYMQNLKKMGYSNPEGYLWYVEKNEVIAVNYENTLF